FGDGVADGGVIESEHAARHAIAMNGARRRTADNMDAPVSGRRDATYAIRILCTTRTTRADTRSDRSVGTRLAYGSTRPTARMCHPRRMTMTDPAAVAPLTRLAEGYFPTHAARPASVVQTTPAVRDAVGRACDATAVGHDLAIRAQPPIEKTDVTIRHP